MGISFFKLEVGDDIFSNPIDSAANAWEKIDNSHPVIGGVLALALPFIAIYFIYTWGKLSKREKNADKRVKKANRLRKKNKGGKK